MAVRAIKNPDSIAFYEKLARMDRMQHLMMSSKHLPQKVSFDLLGRMPDCFECYCKIFHDVYEDLTISDKKITWDQWEKQQLEKEENYKGANDSVSITWEDFRSKSILQIGGVDSAIPKRRILLRSLAEKYGLEFNEKLSIEKFSKCFTNNSFPRYLMFEEGEMGNICRNQLIGVLEPLTKKHQCYFYFYNWLVAESKPFLFKGLLNDIFRLKKCAATPYPQYWWPEDIGWCVWSDYDLTYTFVGGSEELIRAVLQDNVLEAIEVDIHNYKL